MGSDFKATAWNSVIKSCYGVSAVGGISGVGVGGLSVTRTVGVVA